MKIFVPLKHPKLFKSHLAYGEVQEKAVDPAAVSVDTDIGHITNDWRVDMILILGRLMVWVHTHPRIDTVEINRYIIPE